MYLVPRFSKVGGGASHGSYSSRVVKSNICQNPGKIPDNGFFLFSLDIRSDGICYRELHRYILLGKDSICRPVC